MPSIRGLLHIIERNSFGRERGRIYYVVEYPVVELRLLRDEEALLDVGQFYETLVLLGEKTALWKTSRWVAVRTAVLVSWFEDTVSFTALRSVLVSRSADHDISDLAEGAATSKNGELHLETKD